MSVSQFYPCLIFDASMSAYPKSYSWYTLINPGIKILLKWRYYILLSIFCSFINPGACTINFFMAVIKNVSPQAGKFVTVSYFLPCLIFVTSIRAYPKSYSWYTFMSPGIKILLKWRYYILLSILQLHQPQAFYYKTFCIRH